MHFQSTSVRRMKYSMTTGSCPQLVALFLALTGLLPTPLMAAPVAITINSLLDPNAILITEVDVIFVYDQSVADSLPGIKQDWYRNKYALVQQGGDKLQVVTVSAPQGFVSDTVRMPARHREAVKVLVAAYHEAGSARLHEITQYNSVRVDIDSYGIAVSGR